MINLPPYIPGFGRIDVVDEDIKDAQVLISDNNVALGLNNVVLTFALKQGLWAFLAFCGQAWDQKIDTYVTWRAKSDGGVIYRLRDSKVQLAAPEQLDRELTPWIPVPQGARLTLEADVAGAGAAGNVTGRFRVYYANVAREILTSGGFRPRLL